MNVVVTGANRGIGLELVRLLADRGDTVFAACRRSSPELRALPARVLDNIDVADETSVAALPAGVGEHKIDLLINNAGVLYSEDLDSLDWEHIRLQFEVNTLGPLRVTSALLPLMESGSKVGIVSSRVGSLADNTSGGMYGYRISKAGVNMVGVNLARDLQSRGIAVFVLHPGYVRTEMTRGMGNTDARTAAGGLVERLEGLGLAETGTFWHAEGSELPW